MSEAVPRRVLIVTTGSRGDIQPFVALAHALLSRGVSVAIVSHGTYNDFCAAQLAELAKPAQTEYKYYALDGDPEALLTSDEFREAFWKGGVIEQAQLFKQAHDATLVPNMKLAWSAALDFKPTLIVASITQIADQFSVAQKLGVPLIIGSMIPFAPTDEMPICTVSAAPMPVGALNRGSYSVAMAAAWGFNGKHYNAFRKEKLGLGPLDKIPFQEVPILHAYSPVISAVPKDWTPNFHIATGYWTLPTAAMPSEELQQFIEAGDAPIYLGFGSMPVFSVAHLFVTFVDVLTTLGKRGIFCGGFNRVSELSSSDKVLVVQNAPHDWLLPRCSMAIHHGGAGTTAAVLRAGIPNIIFTVLGDQLFWANRCWALGVHPPKMYTIRDLFQYTLEQQINAASAPEIQEKAKQLSQKLLSENGAATAAEFIIKALPKEMPKQLHWQWDHDAPKCTICSTPFTFLNRRHHCMRCGNVICGNCNQLGTVLNFATPRKVCKKCLGTR
eukprot:TRINITY_DN9160_c0_g2_i1.p1 TRINITY_DN9160_c0_g2~~TRINITY_DN9160_c0_g2_i1.p1  ORF type:complete len:499 (+),score=171.15 TRINITY_DN9160_c0_g2_i1:177-1673(+)